DQDAPSNLFAEPSCAGFFLGVDQIVTIDAKPIAHAVVAREVRRTLGRRNDVISRKRILSVWKRNVMDRRAGGFQPCDAVIPKFADFARHAVDAVFLRHTYAQTFD